ncbi:MAG: hypothetical protein GY820_37305 [Gammaproteobacteria bacterium]|nr:hypothetical protein [Gammaproteobacteria bacterium]
MEDDLKQKIADACAGIEQEIIDRSLAEFKKRMEKVIGSDGRHTEHLPCWIALKFSTKNGNCYLSNN